jgi:hypothetical protein
MAQRRSLSAVYCLLFLFSFVHAQSPADKKESNTRKPAKTKAIKAEEVDPAAAQRHVVALSLLQTLADDARSFHEQRLRARVQARVADALWDSETEKARALFSRAWEAAELEDAESARRAAEERQRLEQSTGVSFRGRRPDLRAEVLRLAAKRDRALGEEFLAKLDEANAKEVQDVARQGSPPNPANDPFASSAAEKRIGLARRLLEDGDIERSLQFAGPVLDQVNAGSINFLSALREKNSQAADQGFLSLLSRAERDPASDANTVSGLSSYAFTPFLYVTFSPNGGGSQMRDRPPVPRPDLPPAIRAAFFRLATQILLRPLAPPDQDRTTSGRAGKYLVIKRLLPLYEEFAPQLAPTLRTQMAAMSGDITDGLRSGENRAVTNGIVPDTNTDPLNSLQERLDRARTSEERDGIYADIAVAASGKDDPRAKDLVDKIEDSDLRKRVRAYNDFQSAQTLIEEKNALEAVRIAKAGELTSLQRVWVYTRAARLLLASDRPRAVELLEDASVEARRIGGTDPDRARALVAVATVMMRTDRVRAWETINEAVKAANATEEFSGEDSQVNARLQTKRMVVMRSASAEDFDLLGAFQALGRDDLYRAIQLAKTLTAESPRAVATLAIARSVLEKSSSESPALN